MELKVIWTDPAIEDLRKIRDYIAKDNPLTAVSFAMELFRSTRHLGSFPKSCRVYQQNENGLVRELPYRGYRIFYQEYKTSASSSVCSATLVWKARKFTRM